MKITTFTPTVPFEVERDSEDEDSATTVIVGIAVGLGLTNEGFAVPVFANASVVLHHGDHIVRDSGAKLLIGDREKTGTPIFEEGTPTGQAGPGRPPKKRPPLIQQGPWDISFGEQTFKLTSSWHFKSESEEFVFQMDGGFPAPKDHRVTKVNRDTFNELSGGGIPIKAHEEVMGWEKPETETVEEEIDALSIV